jgi:hypothetical protein
VSNLTLEQVQELAQQLSPEDRKSLVNFLFSLPDGDFATATIDPPSPLLSETDRKIVEESAKSDQPIIISTDTYTAIFIKGRPIFQVYFYGDNFQKSRMEIRSWKDSMPSEKVINEVREVFKLHTGKELTDEQIIEACKQPHVEIFEAETFRLAKEFSARLPHIVWLLYEAGMEIVNLGFRNDFARRTGQRTKTLDEMIVILEPFWKRIKEHLSVTPGGRRNVKHEWSMRDYACLEVHYERLKPIWREAKKTARESLKAKEPIRQKRWKEQVAAIYKDENLPDDLVEHLAPPEDWPPADLALIHAARLCVPDVTYSLKVLKGKLHYLRDAGSLGNAQKKGSSSTP